MTPHKILALDSGGIRGIVSVEVLAEIEDLLRRETGQPQLRLAEWFDLIAGTSTGAITATLLALGHTVAEVGRFYDEEAHELFAPAALLDRLRYRYDATRFIDRLQNLIGRTTTLGSDRLRTLLLIVLRNATTDSPWFLTNHPGAKFNDRRMPGCNLDLPLWQLVRASTAAPTLFGPETVAVGDETFVFSDGVLTGYGNPAFKAFLIATVAPYGVGWTAAADQLLVVSVGTGTPSLADATLDPDSMDLLYHARTLPRALLSSSQYMQDLLCRVFGECLVGEPLDLEVGDLIGARGPADPKLFTYLRYDVSLTSEGLAGIGCGDLDPASLSRPDDVTNMVVLRRLGKALARERIHKEHFKRFLP